MLKDGYIYLLPDGLLDYFSVLQVEESKTKIKIYMEENNINNPDLESKGFYPTAIINDFPFRDKALLLDLRCRTKG